MNKNLVWRGLGKILMKIIFVIFFVNFVMNILLNKFVMFNFHQCNNSLLTIIQY